MSIVVAENISKKYGELTAVDGFSFSAEKGTIVALVGPDGAGKTTLFRVLCGLMSADGGVARIAEFDVGSQFSKIKNILGYMPQIFSLYPDLGVEENLRFYAGLFGIGQKQFDARKEPLYEFSGLGPFRQRRAGDLSGGMKQKLALSCALIHDPEVLILDEPTTGVDPLSRRQFWGILKRLRADGSCIVVSTPYMDEVEQADRAYFIHRGKKLAEGNPEELVGHYRGEVYAAEYDVSSKDLDRLRGISGVEARRFGTELHIYVDNASRIHAVEQGLAGMKLRGAALHRIEPDLEDTFIQLMGN